MNLINNLLSTTNKNQNLCVYQILFYISRNGTYKEIFALKKSNKCPIKKPSNNYCKKSFTTSTYNYPGNFLVDFLNFSDEVLDILNETKQSIDKTNLNDAQNTLLEIFEHLYIKLNKLDKKLKEFIYELKQSIETIISFKNDTNPKADILDTKFLYNDLLNDPILSDEQRAEALKNFDEFSKAYLNISNSFSYKDLFLRLLDEKIEEISKFKETIDSIFVPHPETKGYVVFVCPPTHNIPSAEIRYRRTPKDKKAIPYYYKYNIFTLKELLETSVQHIHLSKHVICKCKVCSKYFINIDRKDNKFCSDNCFRINQARRKSSQNISNEKLCCNKIYKQITQFLNRDVKSSKEKEQRAELLSMFKKRHKEKLSLLDSRYKTHSTGYYNELYQWLLNEQENIKTKFPSNKFGNSNRISNK